MRVFIAVDLPNNVKDYVYSLHRLVDHKLASVNWVRKENLHATLKFLGDIDMDTLGKVKERMASVKFNPFKMKLTKIGYFPSASSIRVVWVGLEPAEPLIGLHQKVDIELMGLFPQEKQFSVHLTIGRVKSVEKRKELREKLDSLKIEPLEFEVKNFKMMKSDLQKGEPLYEELAVF